MNRRDFLKAAGAAAGCAFAEPATAWAPAAAPVWAFSPGAALTFPVDASFEEIFGSTAWLCVEQLRRGER